MLLLVYPCRDGKTFWVSSKLNDQKEALQAYRQGFERVNLRDGDLRGHAASRALMSLGAHLHAAVDVEVWTKVYYSRRQRCYDSDRPGATQISDKQGSAVLPSQAQGG